MANLEIILIPVVFGSVFVTFFIFFFILLFKISRKKMRISTYFWIRSAKVKFKIFDLSVMHSLFVFPNRQYEVVYRLRTEKGTIAISVDDQVKVETSSVLEGSKVITIKRFKPIVSFEGEKAENGEAFVRLYRKR